MADLDRLYATVRKEKGALDIVVANAGMVERLLLEHATPKHFDRTFAVDVKGPYFTIQKALPLLRDGGRIVLISSVAHLIGVPEHSAYSAPIGRAEEIAPAALFCASSESSFSTGIDLVVDGGQTQL